MRILSRLPWMVVLLVAASLCPAQSQSWELQGDEWQAVNRPPTSQPVIEPDATLDQVEQLITQGRYNAARKLAVRWLNQPGNRSHPLRDRGLYLLAEAYYGYGNRIRAFYHLDELMDFHPDSPLYPRALQRQYDIADAYLKGYKNRFLGMPLFGAQGPAIDMLFRIQQRAPGSPLAEKALLRTADYYYADGQFDLAEDAYAAYLRSYPRSPLAPRVRLRQAFSNYAQFRGLRFDATPLLDARAQLVELASANPDLAAEENLGAFVERIDTTLARKMLVTAEFYERTNEDRAAAYYYRRVIRQYADTPEAREAEQALARLPQDTHGPAARPLGGGAPEEPTDLESPTP